MGKRKRTDKGVNEGITKVSEGRGRERDDRRKEGKRKPYTAPTRYLKLKTLG